MSYVLLDTGLRQDSPIGMGARYCVVTEGRKWVHLYYAPTCTAFKVPAKQYAQYWKRVLVPGRDYSPKRTAKRIRAKQRQFAELGLFDGGRAAEQALETLKGDIHSA